MKDIDKLDGEACNADGTLKDAEEMAWQNSPLDVVMPPFMKDFHDDLPGVSSSIILLGMGVTVTDYL